MFKICNDSEDPPLLACRTTHCIPRSTSLNDEWDMQCAAYQDKWPSDSLPACKDLTSVREPVETVCPFVQFVTFAQMSTYCHLSVYLEVLLSQQRSTFNQHSDAFSGRHDPTTHPRRARCLARVRPIFNECCHCHCLWPVTGNTFPTYKKCRPSSGHNLRSFGDSSSCSDHGRSERRINRGLSWRYSCGRTQRHSFSTKRTS